MTHGLQSVRGPWVQGTLVRARTISYFPAIPGTATKIVCYFITGASTALGLPATCENVDLPLHTYHLCFCWHDQLTQITTSEWNNGRPPALDSSTSEFIAWALGWVGSLSEVLKDTSIRMPSLWVPVCNHPHASLAELLISLSPRQVTVICLDYFS